jgi:hypothetical protein
MNGFGMLNLFRLAFVAWLLSPTLDNFGPQVQIPQEHKFS